MSTPVRLGVFASGLVLAFVAAWGAGSAVGPILDEPAPAQHGGGHDDD